MDDDNTSSIPLEIGAGFGNIAECFAAERAAGVAEEDQQHWPLLTQLRQAASRLRAGGAEEISDGLGFRGDIVYASHPLFI